MTFQLYGRKVVEVGLTVDSLTPKVDAVSALTGRFSSIVLGLTLSKKCLMFTTIFRISSVNSTH